MTQDPTSMRLAAREVPFPTWLSPQAQAVLASGLGPLEVRDYPELGDLEGWRRFAAAWDELMLVAAESGGEVAVSATFEEIDVDGVRVFVFTPAGWEQDDRRLLYDIHGGGFLFGGGECLKMSGRQTCERYGVRTWSVDYRMPPDHPYPTPLEDCLTVFRVLLRSTRPQDLIVIGGSAGANLATAMLLQARDEGLPMPAAAALLMITSGTRDLLLSSAVRLHRKLRSAGVPAELHIEEAAGHGGFLGQAPEDLEIEAEVARFIDEHWPAQGCAR